MSERQREAERKRGRDGRRKGERNLKVAVILG